MTQRVERVNELIRRELANIINKEAIIEGGLITITKVICSQDLKSAKVYISILPEKLSGSTMKKVRSKSRFFVSQLTKKINMKFIPKLTYIVDDAERYVAQIDKAINEIKQEKNEE